MNILANYFKASGYQIPTIRNHIAFSIITAAIIILYGAIGGIGWAAWAAFGDALPWQDMLIVMTAGYGLFAWFYGTVQAERGIVLMEQKKRITELEHKLREKESK